MKSARHLKLRFDVENSALEIHLAVIQQWPKNIKILFHVPGGAFVGKSHYILNHWPVGQADA